MSALARLALEAGSPVSGSDREASEATDAVAALGAEVSIGHSASALPDELDAVIVSTAIADDNEELLAARQRGVPTYHRADLLASLMRTRRPLVVAGAHGKSTTSAMLAAALGDVSCCIGARIDGGHGTGARWGSGEWFVAEGDESDRSLLSLPAEAAILLNVDHDHHATFDSIEEVEALFAQFISAIPPEGCLVVGPDERARALADAARCDVRCVGGPEAFVAVVDGPTGVELRWGDGRSLALELAVPGQHNAGNAACALVLAEWCGVAPEDAALALSGFHGVGRRFEERGSAGGVRFVDDYAHHPAELAATLAAARGQGPDRIVAVFQPHLASRTRALASELGVALGAADVAIVTDIYLAREPADPGVSGEDVCRAVPPGTTAVYAPTLLDARDAVLAHARPGDLVLTLGAGDVTELGEELLGALGTSLHDGSDGHGRTRHTT
jgi:UDP-N-acetylmuramate--alanine ligase